MPKQTNPTAPEPKRMAAEDLDDRQLRGVMRSKEADKSNGLVFEVNASTTLWMSKRDNRAWRVEREQKNRRGVAQIEYVCSCGDHQKNARLDCQHIFAERIRRGEVIIDGEPTKKRAETAVAARREPRQRISATGKTMRAVQREARMTIGDRIPELLRDLARGMAA